MISLPIINANEIELFKQPGLNEKKSEVLCRMGILSYKTTESELLSGIGNDWSGSSAWLSDDVENQGFAAWADGMLVIVFRGTDSWEDWKKNANFLFSRKHPLGGRRHNGFHEVWEQKKDQVIDLVNHHGAGGNLIWIVGHSLGGAVATAAAAELLVKDNSIKDRLYVMTYGAPRYGNQLFQKKYDELMEDHHWFFANQRDPVPHLPPKLSDFRHAGVLKYFNKDGDPVGLSKGEAGLQSGDDGSPKALAAKEWQGLDQFTEQYLHNQKGLLGFLEEFSDGLGDPAELDEAVGELHGDSVWTSDSHKSALYWQRIVNLANPAP